MKQEINPSYILDCKCTTSPGIIIQDNKLLCRWCHKELIEGGYIVSTSKHLIPNEVK